VVISHPLSASSICYDSWHPSWSIYMPDSLFPQSLSKLSLVYLLAWHPPLHTAYISSSFRSTCPYHRNLFCCSTEIMLSNPSLSLNPLIGTLSCSLTPHIYLAILISARWSATSFFFLTGQVSLSCNVLLRTQLLYNLPLTVNDISLLVSNGTNCLNFFRPIWIHVFWSHPKFCFLNIYPFVVIPLLKEHLFHNFVICSIFSM